MTAAIKPFRILLISLGLLAPVSLHAQDVVTVGSGTVAAGGTIELPVYIRDVSGTTLGSDATKIQALVLRFNLAPASMVSSVAFARAAGAAPLTPLYERTGTVTQGGVTSLTYVGSFAASQSLPLAPDGAAPGTRIGTLTVSVASGVNAGTPLSVTFDGQRTLLSNQAATITETAINRQLAFTAGQITTSGQPTTTVLQSTPNPSAVAQQVTLTATVSGSGNPTGNVAFRSGSLLLGRSAISAGQASLSTTALPHGTNSLTATYEADLRNLPSTSAAVSQVVSASVFGAPASVTAIAPVSSSVKVTWTPVQGANAYSIFRREQMQPYGLRQTVQGQASTSNTDMYVSSYTTYGYYVVAHREGETSPPSQTDYATTINLTDDPLTAGTLIRRAHLDQLRSGVNAFEVAAGLAMTAWTDPSLIAGMTVKRVHLTQLRVALQNARSVLGLPPLTFTDPDLGAGVPIKAIHFQELREAIK